MIFQAAAFDKRCEITDCTHEDKGKVGSEDSLAHVPMATAVKKLPQRNPQDANVQEHPNKTSVTADFKKRIVGRQFKTFGVTVRQL